jgi:hypothetical protein
MSAHRLTSCNTNADPACWGWYQARCSCGWAEVAYGEQAALDAHEAHVATVPVVAPPTGYLDSFGNVWAFSSGHTVIDGVTVRGRPGRRMLAVGEVYMDTHGERRIVVAP